VALDVVGQLWFKLGLMRLPEKQATDHVGLFWKRVFSSPLLWAGIGAYAIELGLWLAVLANAPLSFVFPLASLGYVGVLVASRIVLKETISARRWAGALLITLGVALVYIGGQG
jgi:drug/metabolite transporter (DMT)-like permease